ncbi:hypothetical protein K474DRAFT_1626401 [Panus rudis PR-1116 ss-1]|nr:hypothetical protein K474DRAFT_1626401 [Panus rudis PR-1116 ss-1]
MASPLPPSTPFVAQDPSTFTASELERSLSEQSFGITSYEIISTSKAEAEARVVLLEGETITISLTCGGYRMKESSDDKEAGGIYETLESLLSSVSKMYGEARQKTLMEKLFALSTERQEQEDTSDERS